MDEPCNVYEVLSLPYILVFYSVSYDYHTAEKENQRNRFEKDKDHYNILTHIYGI